MFYMYKTSDSRQEGQLTNFKNSASANIGIIKKLSILIYNI